MLTVLHSLHPDAVPHSGPAEALPVADGSVDAVLVADAWHWFDREQAVAEVRRVLRPGGWLGLVWNLVTPKEPWELELAGIDPDRTGRVDEVADADAEAGSRPSFPDDETETARFPWTWEVTPQHWRGYLATNSAVAAMPEEQREQRLDRSQTIVNRVCEETGRPTVSLQHEAYCVRWRPR